MGKMLKQAREMQSRLAKLQEELGRREVEGRSPDGLVTVTMNGRAEILRVHIDPGAVADVAALESRVTDAFRAAHAEVQKLVQNEMGAGAGFLGLPGM
jgi:DNA-binding YbaB/EbfC family protein